MTKAALIDIYLIVNG